MGFTTDMKAYKADPDAFPGTVADISTFIRQAVTGKTNSPDLYTVTRILGYERTCERVKEIIKAIDGLPEKEAPELTEFLESFKVN